jgi:acetylornithine deacetylase
MATDEPRIVRTRAPFSAEQFEAWWAARQETLVERLLELVAIPTTSPDEERCHPWLMERVEALGGSACVEAAPRELSEHPDFTHTPFSSHPRANLRARFPAAAASAQRLLLNAHVDVVPADDFADAFSPYRDGDRVVGRGVADTKNNIVMALAAIELLRDLDIDPSYELLLDFVTEEEIGGNGTLASIVRGSDADEVIVLEPTSLEVFHGHRGCLSFEVHVQGRASHMGGGGGISAIDGAVEVITALKRLERRLSEAATSDALFGAEPPPTPINVGAIHGGQWHGSLPDRCELRANVGFLPPDDVPEIKRRLERALAELPAPWDRRCTLTYSGIHNGAYVIDPGTPLVTRLLQAKQRQGAPTDRTRVWGASCDARYYDQLLGVPVVVFGSGDLDCAHGATERLSLAQLKRGVRVLGDLLATPLEEA